MSKNNVVAVVEIRPISDWFSWYVFSLGRAGDQAVGASGNRTDAIRAAALVVGKGTIGVMSDDCARVAYVDTSAVPEYEFLQWESTVVQKVDLGALALASL